MGRPREFDREAVLDRALELFWDRGYEGTSMSDLVETLGVGRQSLYDTFGDKQALYLLALERYRTERSITPWHLLEEKALRVGLRALLVAIVDCLVESPQGRTCMMVNAAAERAPHDPEVKRLFCATTQLWETRLEERLRRAQQEGELGRHHDVRALARFLANTIFGLQVTGKSVTDRAHLMQIVDVTMSILG